MIKNYHEQIHEYTNTILNSSFYFICDFEYNFVYLNNSRKLRKKSGKLNKKRYLLQPDTTVQDMKDLYDR